MSDSGLTYNEPTHEEYVIKLFQFFLRIENPEGTVEHTMKRILEHLMNFTELNDPKLLLDNFAKITDNVAQLTLRCVETSIREKGYQTYRMLNDESIRAQGGT